MNFDAVVPHELDEDAPGGMVVNPASALGKELRKWEQHPGPLGRNPGNPYTYRPYPKMLYKAQAQPNGQVRCLMDTPHPLAYQTPEAWQQAVQQKEYFDKTCVCVVDSESAERIKVGQGWCADPAAAMEQHEREQTAIFTASAEVAHSAQRMSDKAKRELAAAEGETHEHVLDVRGAKPGRKPKAIAASGEVAHG